MNPLGASLQPLTPPTHTSTLSLSHQHGNLQHIPFCRWTALVQVLVKDSGFATESLNSKWDAVTLYNRYRHAYEVVIVAVLIYVREVVPPALLEHPEHLIKMADKDNKGQWLK